MFCLQSEKSGKFERPEDFYKIKTVSKDPETEIAYLIHLFLTNFPDFRASADFPDSD
jgi:hypothetical protein